MAKKAYRIILRHDGKDAGVLRMDAGCEAAAIGRSHQCALRTPEDDASVSGVHARLFWKGGDLWFEDAGSRNGVYFRGVRLQKPHKVAGGDFFAVGSCSVLCERISAKRDKAATRFHRLECLNGECAGRTLNIVGKDGEEGFTIGLDPSCALRLPDLLVSRKHAVLTVRDNGECWIRDLDSRNGTFVNGEPLRGKERLLKDNDKISIAYFDFRFLDRSVTHTRFFLWLKVIVVAATLCVMAGAYVMWVTASATVDDHLRMARAHAANRHFKMAKEELEAARITRDADLYRAQINALDAQLELWQRTSDEWNQAQSLLRTGGLRQARKILDPLTSGVLGAWVWNGNEALREKHKAEFCAQALRWYYDAEEVLAETGAGHPEQQADRIRARAVPLAEFMAASTDLIAAQPYLATLTNKIAAAQRRMGLISEGFSKVDACIAELDAVNPNFAGLATKLEKVISDKKQHGSVRAYADKYRIPCAELAEAQKFIRGEFEDVNAMRFTSVREKADGLKLPEKLLCARHPRLSEHRKTLEIQHADVQKMVRNLAQMVDGLSEKGVVGRECGRALEHVLNEDLWKKVLTFDCFEEKPPTTRRKAPSGRYDELLGVDYTYQALRALPENYNGWCLRMIGFSPDVVEARKTLVYVDEFVKFVSERPTWVRKGELGAFYGFCQELQEKRRQLLAFLAGYKGGARAELITHFYAGYFAESFDDAKRKALAERFKDIQRDVFDLCEKYAAASDPVAQISIRARLLGTGIPGDAQLHSKWVQKYEGGVR